MLHLIDKSTATYENKVRQKGEGGEALARAALAAFGRRDQSDASTLLGLFQSRKAAIAACARVVESDFGLPEVLDRD